MKQDQEEMKKEVKLQIKDKKFKLLILKLNQKLNLKANHLCKCKHKIY